MSSVNLLILWGLGSKSGGTEVKRRCKGFRGLRRKFNCNAKSLRGNVW
ncbi:MAG: hypothetical protein ACTS5R_02290 [Candidatus Hodgkinia cicadicola]